MGTVDQSELNEEKNLLGVKLNQILNGLMEKNKVSLTNLHRNTGIAMPTIKRMQSDPTTNPTITTLLPIATFFGITVNQLIGEEAIPSNLSGYIEKPVNWLSVPIINWDQAIDWPNKKAIGNSNSILTDAEVGNNPYALIVEEEDWVGFLKNSTLIINSDLQPEHKDYAVVYKQGQTMPTLKQIMIDEEKIYLKPLNTYFSPTVFDETHHFLGVLIQVKNTIKR